MELSSPNIRTVRFIQLSFRYKIWKEQNFQFNNMNPQTLKTLRNCPKRGHSAKRCQLATVKMDLWNFFLTSSIPKGFRCYKRCKFVIPIPMLPSFLLSSQILLLEPNKYSNPILRPSVTSNLSKQPHLVCIQSAHFRTTGNTKY